MKFRQSISVSKFLSVFISVFSSTLLLAQEQQKSTSDFWNHVQFGGGIGASFGSGYTDLALAPGAIYNFNDYVALGVGLQGSYVNVKGDYTTDELNNYKSWIYGGSLIGLFNPVEEIQLSVELEQVRVNTTFTFTGEPDIKDNFWNTALFLGAGYRFDNVTLGARYNLLYDRDKSVYYEPFMPFIRVYF
ncbi:MAG TPA: hypothetical protein VK623_12140 [Flavobacterium sp.]|nr:hypothetical protein [Flavobacterium sp.]